jgi:hypothetical protein
MWRILHKHLYFARPEWASSSSSVTTGGNPKQKRPIGRKPIGRKFHLVLLDSLQGNFSPIKKDGSSLKQGAKLAKELLD